MARRLRRPIAPQSAVSRAVTRKARPFAGTTAEQVRQLERALGSQRAAAERLGVSERTLRRYKAGGRPSRANAEKLTEQARTAPEVRRRALAQSRESRLRRRGAYVRAAGRIAVGGDRAYMRRREIGYGQPVHLSGEQMSPILDAYEGGDDTRALELLQDALSDEYAPGVILGDLELLEFLRDNPSE